MIKGIENEGPHRDLNRRCYLKESNGYRYDRELDIAISTLESFGISLKKAQEDPFGISPTVLLFAGLEPVDLKREFIEVYLAALPGKTAGNIKEDRRYV